VVVVVVEVRLFGSHLKEITLAIVAEHIGGVGQEAGGRGRVGAASLVD